MENTLFDEFIYNFRYISGHVVKWWPINDDSIIVEDDDGYYYLYDSVLNSTRSSKSLEYLLRINVNDKREWTKKFGREFYRAVLKSGYNQEDLSLDSKISSGSISAYTNGEKIPSIYSLLKLVTTMDCTIQELISMLCLEMRANDMIFAIDFIDDKDEWMFEFSIRLLRLLRKYKMTQHEFAEIIDVTPMSVTNYIRGKQIPSAYVIYRIIKDLKLNFDEVRFLLGIV